MTDPDTGGPARNNTRVYPRDSKWISDKARELAAAKGREVPIPEIIAVMCKYFQDNPTLLPALVP